MDYPTGQPATPAVISTYSKYFTSALAIQQFGVGTSLAATNPGSFIPLHPFTIPTSYLIRSFFIANATTVNGNTDIGIYGTSTTGAISLLVSAGVTAQSGSLVLQIRTLGTPFLLSPGSYFLALVNTGTGQYNAHSFTATQSGLCGLLEGTGTALPGNISPARSTQFDYYLAGFSRLASGY